MGWEGSETVVADVRLQGKKPWDSFGFGAHQWLLVDVEELHSTSAVQFRLRRTPAQASDDPVCLPWRKATHPDRLDEDTQNVAPRMGRAGAHQVHSWPEDLDWTAPKEVRLVLENARFTVISSSPVPGRTNRSNGSADEGVLCLLIALLGLAQLFAQSGPAHVGLSPRGMASR